jgi:hypothetical protein
MGEGIQKYNYIKIDRKYLASMEKGISSEDDEWVQNLIHIMEKVLKLKQRITYTYDFKLFNKYGNPSDTVSRGDWGGCSPNEGFIWINAKKHKKSPKQELANTVIHEMLHIKNPTKPESWVRKEADKYVALGE